jgi:plasmid stabilization system protein ParE
MKSTCKIIWSDEAIRNLKAIIDYLENNWTPKEISKFARLLEKSLALISSNPLSFPQIKHPNQLRKMVISKQVSIFYQITENQIRIISIFDNRQNPSKISNL